MLRDSPARYYSILQINTLSAGHAALPFAAALLSLASLLLFSSPSSLLLSAYPWGLELEMKNRCHLHDIKRDGPLSDKERAGKEEGAKNSSSSTAV